jgi:hypothetical protein
LEICSETGRQQAPFVWRELALLFQYEFITISGAPQGKYWTAAQLKDAECYVTTLIIRRVTAIMIAGKQFRCLTGTQQAENVRLISGNAVTTAACAAI